MSTDDRLKYVKDLPGFERGNPVYFENEVIDHLVGIVLELGAELWVVKDRLALLEETLSNQDTISPEALEDSRPSDDLQAKLDADRKALIQRIYGRLYSRYEGDKAASKSAV